MIDGLVDILNEEKLMRMWVSAAFEAVGNGIKHCNQRFEILDDKLLILSMDVKVPVEVTAKEVNQAVKEASEILKRGRRLFWTVDLAESYMAVVVYPYFGSGKGS